MQLNYSEVIAAQSGRITELEAKLAAVETLPKNYDMRPSEIANAALDLRANAHQDTYITAEDVTDGCAIKPVEKECPMPQISKELVKQTIDALECLADDDNQASIILKLQSLLDQPEGEARKQITEADITDEMLASIEHHEERGIGKKTMAKIINIYLLEQP